MEARHEEVYVTEIAKLFPPQGKWTEYDYFLLPDTNQIIELSDGVLIMPPPPSYSHQNTVGELFFVLKQHVDANDLGTAAVAPLAVRLWEGKIREPDVLFFRKEHADRIGEHHCEPPDWVAEVISPGTKQVDEVEKLVEYARAGIPEYWLVDPDEQTIRVYALGEGDRYTLAAICAAGQVARSETLEGFEVAVDRVVT